MGLAAYRSLRRSRRRYARTASTNATVRADAPVGTATMALAPLLSALAAVALCLIKQSVSIASAVGTLPLTVPSGRRKFQNQQWQDHVNPFGRTIGG